jgi:hypothetical protein
MNLLSWILRKKLKSTNKSLSYWRSELINRYDWELENIVINPGEFTVEMRTAAREILAERKSRAQSGD